MRTFAAFVSIVSFTSFACACARTEPVPAQAPKAQSSDPAVIDAVKQVSQDMGDAMVAADIGKLDKIYADDFASVGSSDVVVTKATLLNDFDFFHDKLVSFETGPIDVQVFGRVAVAQGGVKEQRNRAGKDTSGEFAWMDLFENRGGRWVVLRSAATRVAPGDSPMGDPQDPAAVSAIVKLEQSIGDSMVAVDVEALRRAYADDWLTIGRAGDVITKASLLEDFRSQRHKLLSFELGPMKVRVLGDSALAQAGVTEKRTQDGKDESGDFVFMDLLKMRAGSWVVVRTLGARVD